MEDTGWHWVIRGNIKHYFVGTQSLCGRHQLTAGDYIFNPVGWSDVHCAECENILSEQYKCEK